MPVLTLVGGPFDGDTMRFRPEQTGVVVPESAGGPGHVYSVAADGRAHYQGAEIATPFEGPNVAPLSDVQVPPNPSKDLDSGQKHRPEGER